MSEQHKARMLYLESIGKLSMAEKSELAQLYEFFGKGKPREVVKEPNKEIKEEMKIKWNV